jgi:hypothetical protein
MGLFPRCLKVAGAAVRLVAGYKAYYPAALGIVCLEAEDDLRVDVPIVFAHIYQ